MAAVAGRALVVNVGANSSRLPSFTADYHKQEIVMSLAKDGFSLAAIGLLAGLALVGCSSQPTGNSTPAPNGSSPQAGGGESLPEGLVQLSEADRTAALKQDVCPVTGEKLGSMGAPPKIVVSGQEVFLCCAGCEEELRKQPEMYLAKLKSE
jgi:YHS domain-containing protein